MKARCWKKQLRRLSITSLFLLSQITNLNGAWGWGKEGHELLASAGVKFTYIGTKFWTANQLNIVRLSTVPDFLWKRAQTYKTETPTHFFQPDFYFKDPRQFNLIPRNFDLLVQKVGLETAVKEGTTPWRIQQFYDLALNALKQKDFKTAVIMAGVMSHYIGDLSQPLHVTENYDGQMTNNKGIHKFFETTNIRPNLSALNQVVPLVMQKLFLDPNYRNQFKGSIVDVAFNEMMRSFASKDKLINIDLNQGRVGAGAQAQLTLARDRLADGAATLALILSHLWEESGLQDVGATGNIPAPEWIKPNYYSSSSVGFGPASIPLACFQKPQYHVEDDCH